MKFLHTIQTNNLNALNYKCASAVKHGDFPCLTRSRQTRAELRIPFSSQMLTLSRPHGSFFAKANYTSDKPTAILNFFRHIFLPQQMLIARANAEHYAEPAMF